MPNSLIAKYTDRNPIVNLLAHKKFMKNKTKKIILFDNGHLQFVKITR